jgi:hypothetical protein
MTLKDLRARAKTIGVRIEADRNDYGWGYWLLDDKTGTPVWDDDNFCDDHAEISSKLRQLEFERGVRVKAMMPF